MSGEDDRFLLLNDLPVEDRAADLLGTAEVAGKLAGLIHGSRSNTPFVLAMCVARLRSLAMAPC